MRKILATFAAMSAFVVAAYAAEVEGKVQSVDAATRTITLDDGQTFVAAEGVEIAQLEPGANVKITVDDATMSVTSVEKM